MVLDFGEKYCAQRKGGVVKRKGAVTKAPGRPEGRAQQGAARAQLPPFEFSNFQHAFVFFSKIQNHQAACCLPNFWSRQVNCTQL
jgi:hypothetical protein